jgi:hypothetical protein
MAKQLIALAGVVVALCATSGTASAVPPLRNVIVIDEEDVFVETGCGDPVEIASTATGTIEEAIRPSNSGAPPHYSQHYDIVETFTIVETGATIVFEHHATFRDVRIEPLGGTVYQFTAIEAGQPFVIRTVEGDVLYRDRGVIKFSIVVDTLGDDDLSNDVFIEFLGAEVHGPHPLFDEGVPVCELIALGT